MSNAVLYHSGHMLVLARRAYERSQCQSQSSEAMTTIMLAAMSLECFLNELEERLETRVLTDGTAVQRLLSGVLNLLDERRVSVITKIDAIHLVLVGSRLDRGALPFQDLRFLHELRNALVHRRPERFEWILEDPDKEYEPHRLVSHLVQRKVIVPPRPKEPAVWSQHVLVPETARWAYNTVVDCARQVSSWLPAGALRTVTEMTIQDWRAIP